MTPRAALKALRPIALHAAALAILLWPLVGIEFVPMVDLPGHLAITRVVDDFLHGKYRDTLQLNVDPVHKPTYVLLYALYAVLPKALVGPVAAGLLIALCYTAVCHAIAALGKRSASSPLVVSLAVLLGMFGYSSTFFWGLFPFLLSMPPALIAYRAYVEASGVVDEPDTAASRTNARALVFLAAAVLAHLVHPLASLFLAIMLAGAAGAALVLAIVRRTPTGATTRTRIWSAVWPLVAWVGAVGTLHVLTAPRGYEEALAQSAPALASPFHGLAAARAFLAQIPVELGVVPTRERAATFFPYAVAVAALLAAALGAALISRSGDRRGGADAGARPPLLGLGVVSVLSVLLFLFLRHDLLEFGIRALFFPVRGPGFLGFFFAVLAAAMTVRALAASRAPRVISLVLVVGALALAMERSSVLRVHFVAYDAKVHAFFKGEIPDRYFQRQPFSYGDHIRTYNCYFDATCYDLGRLFFSIYKDATIYPVSRIPTPPGDGK